jgi:hypothetical protein
MERGFHQGVWPEPFDPLQLLERNQGKKRGTKMLD